MAGADRDVSVRLVDGFSGEGRMGQHVVRFDEPEDAGGADTGMTPMQLFLVSLGGCSAVTLRMYAERKGWPLEGVSVEVKLLREGRDVPRIVQEVKLEGDLDDAQRERLRIIAGRCPVHKMVDSPVETEEVLA